MEHYNFYTGIFLHFFIVWIICLVIDEKME